MSIATYNDLLTKIPLWAERTDTTVLNMVPDFIFLAESDVSQMLRVPAMEDDDLLDVVDGRVVIPFDFMELRALTYEDKVLQYLPWDQFVAFNAPDGTDRTSQLTQYFSRQGTNWFLSIEPADNQQVLCHYYRYIPALAADNQSNWLITMSPNVYIYGGLKYLYEFIMDEERAAYWGQKFIDEINKLQLIADHAEYMGTRLAVRTTDNPAAF